MWVDQRLEYEHIKEQKKIPESESDLFNLYLYHNLVGQAF